MAFKWGVRIGFFVMTRSRAELFLLCEPAGPSDADARLCLLWTGTHYEVLFMDDAAWKRACTPQTEGT